MLGLLARRNRGISRQRGYRRSVIHYVKATGDEAFERDVGIDILVETARLWRSLGHFDLDGTFSHRRRHRPRTSTAPSPTTTSTRTSWPSETCSAPPAPASAIRTRRASSASPPDEMAAWRAAADRVVIPYDEKLGVHQQSEGFTASRAVGLRRRRKRTNIRCSCISRISISIESRWSSSRTSCWPCSSATTRSRPEQRARNFEYYERITVRDSSLSACTEAVAAADAGHLRLAFDYAAEAALMDLHDFEHNARDGLHVASLAGTWIAFVARLRRHARLTATSWSSLRGFRMA